MAVTGPWFAWAGFGACALAVGALLSRVSYRMFRRWYHLTQADTTDVADVEPGQTVAVRGTVESPDETVRAYFARSDAVVRRTRIARLRSSSTERGGYRWDWFHDGYAAVPFEITDATGSVRIDPPERCEEFGDLAQFRRGIDPSGVEIDVESGDELPETAESYEEDHRLRHSIADATTRLRIQERFLEPGDEAYVVGKATVDEDGRVVIAGRSEPDLLTVTHDYEGIERAQTRPALFGGMLVGGFAVVATICGTGLVAVGLGRLLGMV